MWYIIIWPVSLDNRTAKNNIIPSLTIKRSLRLRYFRWFIFLRQIVYWYHDDNNNNNYIWAPAATCRHNVVCNSALNLNRSFIISIRKNVHCVVRMILFVCFIGFVKQFDDAVESRWWDYLRPIHHLCSFQNALKSKNEIKYRTLQ